MARKTTAQVLTHQGLVTVEARETSTPGLLVTRHGYMRSSRKDLVHGKAHWQATGGWTVTHTTSGVRFPVIFPRITDAIRYADLLGEFYQFSNLSAEDVRLLPGIKAVSDQLVLWVEHERAGKDLMRFRKELHTPTTDTGDTDNGQARPE